MALAVAILAMAVSAYAVWSNSVDNTGNDFDTDTLEIDGKYRLTVMKDVIGD